MAQLQMNIFWGFLCYTVVVFQTCWRLLSDKLHRGWSSVRVVIIWAEQNLHSVTAAAVVNVIDYTKDIQILLLLFSIPECSFLGTKKLSFPIFKNIFWLFNLFLKVKFQFRQGKKSFFFFWMIYWTVDVMFPSSQPISGGMTTAALFSPVEVEQWRSPRHGSE